jgi:hypothetical protein
MAGFDFSKITIAAKLLSPNGQLDAKPGLAEDGTIVLKYACNAMVLARINEEQCPSFKTRLKLFFRSRM